MRLAVTAFAPSASSGVRAVAKMILAHHNGLLTCCELLKRDGERVRVKVVDEKRPKWVDLATGKQALFGNTDEAIAWIEGGYRG